MNIDRFKPKNLKNKQLNSQRNKIIIYWVYTVFSSYFFTELKNIQMKIVTV